ncbi:ankyrin repeat and LEM domain-containing protein 2-like [Actinia tenebrosa]|uniref:Ankyrin repeat and LEM domain-containing protein 2 n=1 Tax=Actinia tenebrosa TaxID=6105 RepID=A0A6P8IRI9_ACTTE|nr:ankyrin repeat and LEM domain-containing protein 2-like [Actinia tenebrosa]
MADKLEISALTADELLAELRAFGLKTGPITPTTRNIFEKKLAKARGEKLNPDIEEIRVISCDEDVDSQLPSTDTTDFISTENQGKNSHSSSASFYYGVSFDRNSIDESATRVPTVYTTKHDALEAVKKLKDKAARFKPFKTRHEAEVFSLSSGLNASNGSLSSVPKVTDPASSFKNPKPQELVKFRKIIEKGSSQEFLDFINSNPKYLISSGDTPVILQEGFRYNAMHVAAKENKPNICKLIVETLESDEFWKKYLSVDKNTVSQTSFERKQVLVDLYLNTPDKGNFETPLHFACKFGHIDVVEYLVSHPLTNVGPRNKYGDTPNQVACSRCTSQTSVIQVKNHIKHLLEDNYYVPVFGSEGDATPPRIGEPWSPDFHSKGKRTPSYSSSGLHSPVDPRVTVKAYAGPMSPKQAFDFHLKWKTPPSNPEERRKYADIKRGDCTRGLERIGRSLAHSREIPWVEYWDFLGCYIDLATPSGLEVLEQYFSSKLSKVVSENVSPTPSKQVTITNSYSTPATGKSDVNDVFLSDTEESPLNMTKRIAIPDDTSPTFQQQRTTNVNTKSPLSPQTDINSVSQGEDEVSDKTESLTLDFKKLFVSPDSKEEELTNASLSETPNMKTSLKSPGDDKGEKDFILCKKNLFDELNKANEVDLVDMRIQTHYVRKSSEEDLEISCKEKDKLMPPTVDPKHLENTANVKNSSISPVESPEDVLSKQVERLQIDSTENENTSSLKNEASLKTSSTSSANNAKGSQSSSNFGSPEECKSLSLPDGGRSATNQGRQKKMVIFIQGFYPSKLDLDVLRALNGVTIFCDKYPHVSRWRDLVMSYSSTVRESWPSPGSPLNRKRHKSMLAWSC